MSIDAEKTVLAHSYAKTQRSIEDVRTALAFLTNFSFKGICFAYGIIGQLYSIGPFKDSSLTIPASIGAVQLTLLNSGPAFPDVLVRNQKLTVMLSGTLCLVSRVSASFTSSQYLLLIFEGLLFGTAASVMNETAMRPIENDTRSDDIWPTMIAGCGVLMGAGFWSFMAHTIAEAYGIAWMQRGLSMLLAVFFTATLALTCHLSQHEPKTSCGEDDKPEENGDIHSSLLETGSLAAIFCLYTGCSVAILLSTLFAVDHGLSSSHLAHVQVGFFKAAVLGHLMIGTFGAAVSEKCGWLLGSALSGLVSAFFPIVFSDSIIVLYFTLLGFLLGAGIAKPPMTFVRAVLGQRLHVAGLVAACIGSLAGPIFTAAVMDATERGWVGGNFVCTASLLAGFLILAVVSGIRDFVLNRRLQETIEVDKAGAVMPCDNTLWHAGSRQV